MGDQLAGRRRLARPGDDDGDDRLSPLAIVAADDRDVGHAGMRGAAPPRPAAAARSRRR